MSLPVRVTSLGRFARAALSSGEARVIAVFERSAYVDTPAGLACIGSVGNGPLNARCELPSGGIAVGESVVSEFMNAPVWKMRSAPRWDRITTIRGVEHLRVNVRGHLPAEGFGCIIGDARQRTPAVDAFAQWLADPAGHPDGARGLIGLGPGLTPSGDDLIGGALCALHAAGRKEIARRLSDWALPIARTATNRISNAHLACAAEGECGEAVNDAIVALLSGDGPDLGRIDAIGHTSGWDALAGAFLALAALASR